jgi:hypothetical protein
MAVSPDRADYGDDTTFRAGGTRDAEQVQQDKTVTNLCHGVNLNQCTAKRKITTIKLQDSCEGEDLDDIYPRVRQFLDWRKESHDIDIRLEALFHSR